VSGGFDCLVSHCRLFGVASQIRREICGVILQVWVSPRGDFLRLEVLF
jgi:hypothetical protein